MSFAARLVPECVMTKAVYVKTSSLLRNLRSHSSYKKPSVQYRLLRAHEPIYRLQISPSDSEVSLVCFFAHTLPSIHRLLVSHSPL